MKPLHKLSPGEKAFIVDMYNSKLCERLFELGVFPGDVVVMEENCANTNLIVVSINNHTFNIYKKAAETIITNSVNFEVCMN